MFLLVSVRHVGAHLDGGCMASLGEVSAYLLPLIYQILDFIY